MTTDNWRTPIDVVRGMVEKQDATGRLPKVALDAEGNELLSSRLRRVVEAAKLEPKTREVVRLTNLWAKDVELWNREQAEAFHQETPRALADMGLEKLEIDLLPELQQRWGAVAAVNTFLYGGTLNSPRSFLTLGGKPGTGKTIAAASALLSCVEELRTDNGRKCQRWTRRGLYMRASELSRLPLFGKENLAAWERLRERKLLIIDDLGAETPSEWWLSAFGDLVDARMRGERKTILTTNLSGQELRERYGDRVIRRLVEYGRFEKCEKPAEPVAP